MMTMTPLDPSLDVSRRLADLRTWQAQWQHIDRQLEEQVSHLDGNNFLQLQQSVHISNVRRRMEMTLVKQPLSIPESVLKHLGVRAIRELFAQQFARLSSAAFLKGTTIRSGRVSERKEQSDAQTCQSKRSSG